MTHFSLRDVFWLTLVVVATAAAYWLGGRNLQAAIEQLQSIVVTQSMVLQNEGYKISHGDGGIQVTKNGEPVEIKEGWTSYPPLD